MGAGGRGGLTVGEGGRGGLALGAGGRICFAAGTGGSLGLTVVLGAGQFGDFAGMIFLASA